MRPKPLSTNLDTAIEDLPPSAAALFRNLIAHPDFDCQTGRLQMMIRFRNRKLGGLNRRIGHWYLSKVFVRDNEAEQTVQSHGFSHAVKRPNHEYWVAEGPSAMTAFQNAVEAITGTNI